MDAGARFQVLGAEAYVMETHAREAERLLYLGTPAASFALAEQAMTQIGGSADAAAGWGGPLLALLERTAGMALSVSGNAAEGSTRLQRGIAAARSAGAEFELALTLDAWDLLAHAADPTRARPSAAREEADAIFRRLNVVTVARPARFGALAATEEQVRTAPTS